MKSDIKEILRFVLRFFTNRILWLVIVAAVLFYVLTARLFYLQIVISDTFLTPPPQSRYVTRSVPARRGTIYDRYGRPLAINVPVFVAMLDPSVVITNEALLELAYLFEQNGDNYVDDFPISREEPFQFLFTGTEASIARQEFRWKADMAVPEPHEATAEESWIFLREQFNIDPELSNEDARRIMNLRAKIFYQRLLDWNNYTPMPFIIAYDVSPNTIATIAEQNLKFGAVYTDITTLREYPAGHYVSHMMGYLRTITAEQFARNEHRGYTADDLFGRAGLELSMEHHLRGKPGEQTFEVNSAGRRISEPVWNVEPQPGNRVFLTIDLELQKAAFHILEEALSESLIRRLTLRTIPRNQMVTPEEAFISFMKGYNLDIRRVLEAEDDNAAYAMRQHIITRYPEASMTRESEAQIQNIILEGLERGFISAAQMLLTLIGTEQISDPTGEIATQLRSRPNTAVDIMVQKIRERELTPQMFNIDPSTGSVVVTNINTGEVLAAVSYPSYDNNRLANTFDAEYFRHINELDPTHPMTNRPFMETRAPGSTFKMFTATAALEEGVISTNSRISDGGRHHTLVGCRGCGSVNVIRALAVSCNVFFAECGFRLGNARHASRSTVDGITTLNRYMEFFGLNDPTGVEIGEVHQQYVSQGYLGNTMPSPEFKIFRERQFNPNASVYDLRWRDADTAQVTIGQGYSNYTPAQMARGMAIIGSRGRTYPLRLVGTIENSDGIPVQRLTPTPVESDIEISETTWDAVIEGMRLVTTPGSGGTAVNVFRNFPITVAGKTGTAEQVGARFSHTAFGAFAPYEDPQIAIYVNVPFSASRAYSQMAAHVARDVIGVALGLQTEPEHPLPLYELRQ